MVTMLRPSRAVFRFSGPEAQRLLFDVVTGRLLAEPGPAVWWALLSPQGKLQAEGLSGWADDAFWLDVDAGVADAFLKRMRMYKLRAAVEIEDLRETHAVGWTAEDPGSGGAVHADPRAGGLGWRIIAEKAEAEAWAASDAEPTPTPGDPAMLSHEGPPLVAYEEVRIGAGVAELGPDFPPDAVFPHDIGMDLLGGVDFKKGCYVGQEVVSRMQHRGTARRRPAIVTGLPDGAAAGAPVLVGEREAGTVGQVVGGKAVAVLRLDRVPHAEAATFGGLPVVLHLPAWSNYNWGRAGDKDGEDGTRP